MVIVELLRSSKNCCGNSLHIFKRKRNKNQILLAQAKQRSRFRLAKKRQQLIVIHERLPKDDHLSNGSDNKSTTDVSIDKPEFEYMN